MTANDALWCKLKRSKRRWHTRQRYKLETLWSARTASYCIEAYDFQFWKISDPPPPDADPIIIPFPISRIRAVIREMR